MGQYRPPDHHGDTLALRVRPRCPDPGGLITAFCPRPGTCFRMIYSRQLQADHCRQSPAWNGVWRDAKGKSWYVEACREHAPKRRPRQ
jgi:hypothetical protein